MNDDVRKFCEILTAYFEVNPEMKKQVDEAWNTGAPEALIEFAERINLREKFADLERQYERKN